MPTQQPLPSPSILIAAFSGRALAQSAQRAGYRPLVVDCFADEDTRAAAHALECLPARVQVGFTKGPLIRALERLAAAQSEPPLGLVLGAGFECNPRLVAALADRFTLLGNGAETIQRVKDPRQFFDALTRLGIRHPETQLTPPALPDGWLMKRIGGTGGLHIHKCPAKFEPDPRRYFQREAAGEPLSVLAVANPRGTAFALSRQWTSPRGRRPYRYGGAVSGLAVPTDLETQVLDIALAVLAEFELTGLVSLDFLVDDGEPLLLEVNPRPGATLDVLDDAKGSLFAAHLAAVRGENAAIILQKQWHPPRSAAAAYLYADRGALTVPAVAWPGWTADRPPAGTAIGRGQPVATVRAEADTSTAAEQLCRDRLGALADLMYVN